MMNAKLLQLLNRLEDLSLRERVMVVAGVPLALVAAAEALWFTPARDAAAHAAQESERLRAELATLQAQLSAQPATAPLPAADQLQRERGELRQRVAASRELLAAVSQPMAWGSVLRPTASGVPGLAITQLKALPAEAVFTPAMARQALAPASKPGAPNAAAAQAASAAPVALPDMPSIYRHRAEIALDGEFAALLRYLQSLQRAPGELYWDRLQFSAANFPQASLQLSLYTLSNRAETPFH
ncbi:hypothetical protein [Azohydromonas lata]|uniref:MSHA biogenesis protein MshJ n=1 Tax=Azohydromonas lata TaxID=45677 RepID=A0ABU5IDJ1_9BURK|nr:hypothetical protein [Azohydromonas lata]MDZ5457027.1 hypothetical protein [Azohydromonas lata]